MHRIKSTCLLKSLLLLILLIWVLEGSKRRSRRKTSLLLKTSHAPILLCLTIAEKGHKLLKSMTGGTNTAATMAMAMPTNMLT